MMDQSLAPGVKNGEEADFGPEMLRIGSDTAQGFGRGAKKNAIDDAFILQGHSGNLLGDREDNVKIGDIEQFGLTILNPVCPGQRLAFRTVAVGTGVVADPLMTALVTLLPMSAQSCGPAHFDGSHHTPMSCRQGCRMFLTIIVAVAAEDIRHLQLRSLQPRSGLLRCGRLGA